MNRSTVDFTECSEIKKGPANTTQIHVVRTEHFSLHSDPRKLTLHFDADRGTMISTLMDVTIRVEDTETHFSDTQDPSIPEK